MATGHPFAQSLTSRANRPDLPLMLLPFLVELMVLVHFLREQI